MYIMSILALLAVSPPALAAEPANGIPQKQKEFRDAKTALEAQFTAFVAQVNACSPPAFRDDVINGFTGATNPESAWNALQVHEKSVADHVREAEGKLASLSGSAIQNACRGGSDAYHLQIVAPAEAIARDAISKLTTDAEDYLKGQKVALQNEGRVRKILGARLLPGASLVSSAAQVEGCKQALAILGEADKNNGPMREADKLLQAKLAALSAGFTERVTAIKDHGRALVAQNACGGPQRRASLFPDIITGARFPADSDGHTGGSFLEETGVDSAR